MNRRKGQSVEKALSQCLGWWNIAIGLIAMATVLLFSFVETPVRPYMIGTVVVMAIIILAHNLRKRRVLKETSTSRQEIGDS
jgi:branched-subunit amino acid transport protein AzlD